MVAKIVCKRNEKRKKTLKKNRMIIKNVFERKENKNTVEYWRRLFVKETKLIKIVNGNKDCLLKETSIKKKHKKEENKKEVDKFSEFGV